LLGFSHELANLELRGANPHGEPLTAEGLAASGRNGFWSAASARFVSDFPSTGYAGNGPQVMATLRNLAVSLLYLSGVTKITRTLQTIARDRNFILDYLPL
jgi:hypothetical protein